MKRMCNWSYKLLYYRKHVTFNVRMRVNHPPLGVILFRVLFLSELTQVIKCCVVIDMLGRHSYSKWNPLIQYLVITSVRITSLFYRISTCSLDDKANDKQWVWNGSNHRNRCSFILCVKTWTGNIRHALTTFHISDQFWSTSTYLECVWLGFSQPLHSLKW